MTFPALVSIVVGRDATVSDYLGAEGDITFRQAAGVE